MPFDPLVTAAIETTLNTLIKDDPQLVRRLGRLKGQVIQVEMRELGKRLTFVFSQQVDVLAQYEGVPDCFLSLNLTVLPELREQSNITRLIKQDKLELEGDIQLSQNFAKLLTDAKPDVEEWLSRLTGDVVAHTLVSGVKQSIGWLQKSGQNKQNQLAQVLTEEWLIAPAPLEVAHFCDQVDDVSKQYTELEIRFQRLLEQS
ncbi:SCP2 domain-containing protein [Vibrio tapetis subsp. quintayensis]|uniref:ubiquinone biosynthesis accessory factor UbiJ n=1 Tax=Vibrio tapetis TaxID=52443 RepID=UPI0025B38376|nr:SCP2 domain-containing protein [Vibrio tapetis]MDN3679587.1 SCP2 domain-containing protein [Vibrio tapetis subsp. quintayensis]